MQDRDSIYQPRPSDSEWIRAVKKRYEETAVRCREAVDGGEPEGVRNLLIHYADALMRIIQLEAGEFNPFRKTEAE